jgi:hypothetical protein
MPLPNTLATFIIQLLRLEGCSSASRALAAKASGMMEMPHPGEHLRQI